VPQNLKVEIGAVGPYPFGSVVPAYALTDAEAKLAGGLVSATDEPVNVDLAPPPDAPPAVADLFPKLAAAERERDALRERSDFLERALADGGRMNAALKDKLAESVAECDRLRIDLAAERSAHEAAKVDLAAAQDLLIVAEPKPE
jgi:hypothetical protein